MKQEEEKEPLLGSDSECRRNYSEAFPVQYTMPDQPRQAKVSFWERRRRKKLLQKYNEYQKRLQTLYERDDTMYLNVSHADAAKATIEETDRKRNIDSLLAKITLITNVILMVANGAASVLSGSLSVISTFLDSAVDCVSGVLIYISTWAISNTDTFNYPRGRARLELIVVLICSIVMGVANIMMIVQSVESIINKSTLAMDQRNDILTSVVALLGAIIADYYWVYADPIGAISVCTFVATSWFYNAADNIPILVGRRGDQENLSRIIRICIEHDEHIKCLDHVMVYHTGSLATVEVHIVLDDHLPLKITHDIIEALTKKISALPFVERAFVHGDYRCDGDWAI